MNQTPHVLFLKTSTPEKRMYFQAIAEAKGYPLYVFDVRDIAGTQHVTDEEKGSSQENNKDKFAEYGTLPQQAADQHSEIHAKLKELLTLHGLEYDPSRIHFSTEDSEMGIPIVHYLKLEPQKKQALDALLPAQVVERLNAKDEKGNPKMKTFPGADLAPSISASLGSANLLRAMQQAFGRVKIEGSIDGTTLMWKTLSQVDKPAQELSETTSLTLDLSPEIRDGGTTADYLLMPDGTTSSAIKYMMSASPRAQIIDQFVDQLGIEMQEGWKREVQEGSCTTLKHTPLFMSGKTLQPTHQQSQTIRSLRKSSNQTPATLAAMMQEQLSKADDALKKSNVMWFEPYQFDDDGGILKSLAETFMFTSAVVARQLNLREAYKPFIILNQEGAFDKDLKIVNRLIDKGMCKDFSVGMQQILPEGIGTEEVKYSKNMYFDVLSGKDIKKLRSSGEELLKHYQTSYFAPPALTLEDDRECKSNSNITEATNCGKGHYKVAVFMSAGSENIELNSQTHAFGKWLADKQVGVVYGAGDRYMMGSLLDGYKEGKGPYIAGFSTAEIIKSETQKGVFSDRLDHAILNNDIYERMAQMIALADDVVVRPGGAGTVQELAAVLLMKQVFKDVPEIAKKRVIIQNPKLKGEDKGFYDEIITRMLGNDALRKYSDAESFQRPETRGIGNDGIYIVDSDQRVEEWISSWKEVWDRNHGEGAKKKRAGSAIG